MHATGSKRVLLVDDNHYFRKAAGGFLRKMPGLDLVGEATSGEQALDLTVALRPDLVLMDIEMRGMTGIEATMAIKRQPNPPKIIIVTMHSRAEFRRLGETAGADGFLLKDDLVEGLSSLFAALFPPRTASGEAPAGQADSTMEALCQPPLSSQAADPGRTAATQIRMLL